MADIKIRPIPIPIQIWELSPYTDTNTDTDTPILARFCSKFQVSNFISMLLSVAWLYSGRVKASLWESKNHNIKNNAPRNSNFYMYNHVICIMNCPKVPSPHLCDVYLGAAAVSSMIHHASTWTHSVLGLAPGIRRMKSRKYIWWQPYLGFW